MCIQTPIDAPLRLRNFHAINFDLDYRVYLTYFSDSYFLQEFCSPSPLLQQLYFCPNLYTEMSEGAIVLALVKWGLSKYKPKIATMSLGTIQDKDARSADRLPETICGEHYSLTIAESPRKGRESPSRLPDRSITAEFDYGEGQVWRTIVNYAFSQNHRWRYDDDKDRFAYYNNHGPIWCPKREYGETIRTFH